MDVGAPLVSNEQAAESMEPGVGAFDDPPVAPERGGGFDALAGDARLNPATSKAQPIGP